MQISPTWQHKEEDMTKTISKTFTGIQEIPVSLVWLYAGSECWLGWGKRRFKISKFLLPQLSWRLKLVSLITSILNVCQFVVCLSICLLVCPSVCKASFLQFDINQRIGATSSILDTIYHRIQNMHVGSNNYWRHFKGIS